MAWPERLTETQPARWSLVDAVIVYAVAQLGTWALLFAAAAVFMDGDLGETALPEPFLIAGMLMVPPVLALGTLLVVRRNGGERILRRAVQGFTPRLILMGIGIGLVTKVGSDVVLLLQAVAGFEPRTNNPLLQFPELEFSTPQLVLLAVAMVVLMPVAEELFFRGYLYRALRARTARSTAVALSAAIFGLAHLNLTLLLPLTLAGVVFALLYESTGSLVPAMVAHGVMNATAVAATFYVMQQGIPI